MTDIELNELLAGLRDEPTPADLLEVRLRVMAQVAEKRFLEDRPLLRSWKRASAVAALAALCICLLVMRTRPSSTAQEEAAVNSILPYIPTALSLQLHLTAWEGQQQERHKSTRRVAIGSVDVIAQADHAPILKLTTTDPKVVILWQTADVIPDERVDR